MVSRIGDAAESSRWTAHIAWVHLHMDSQRLTADLAAEADDRVIAADRAALLESRGRVGTHRVDVTV
jgi:hypothetical protein